MTKISLHHPIHGKCDEVVLTRHLRRNRVIKTWRNRYGKLIDICSIVVTAPAAPQIINIKTGDIYFSIKEAAYNLKCTEGAIRYHLNKTYEAGKTKVKFVNN